MKRCVVWMLLLVFASGSQGFAADEAQEPFYFGVFPYISGNRIVKLYNPLATYFEEELGRSVVIVSAPSFEEFLNRTSQQQYDLIFTAPHFAALEAKRETYTRMVRFENKLKGNIFVAADSPIKTLEDLRGKKIALPDELAVISAMGEFYFKTLGFEHGKNITLQNAPSHINAILSVVKNKADAGVVAWPVYNMFVNSKPNEIRLIGHTDEITGAMFMAKNAYSDEDKKKFLKLFLSFPQSEIGKKFFEDSPFFGMTEISDEEFQSLTPYLEVLEKHL